MLNYLQNVFVVPGVKYSKAHSPSGSFSFENTCFNIVGKVIFYFVCDLKQIAKGWEEKAVMKTV